MGLIGGDYSRGSPLVEFYGYAHENVTRVVLQLANGQQYGTQTFAAWKRSGLRLWTFSVPTNIFTRGNPRTDVLKGYDAAGQVVWQMRYWPRPAGRGMPREGERGEKGVMGGRRGRGGAARRAGHRRRPR